MIFRLCLLLLLVFGYNTAHGQKTPDDYMWEANRTQNDSLALANYLYIIKKHPTSKHCAHAYTRIARIYERRGKQADAISTYRTLLAAAQSERTSKSTSKRFEDEGNEAAQYLCDFHEKNENYDSALYFLSMYDTLFPAFYGCGNAAEGARIETTMRYVNICLKARRIRDAERVLILNSEPSFLLMENDIIIEKLSELFRKYEQPAELRSGIEKAINNYSLDTVIRLYDGSKDTSVFCSMDFLGTKVRHYYTRLPSPKNTPVSSEKEEIIAFLKQTSLYTLVQQLN